LKAVDWIDAFTQPICQDIVIDSLRDCQEHKGLQVFGYVIMYNHIHLITNSPDGLATVVNKPIPRKLTNK